MLQPGPATGRELTGGPAPAPEPVTSAPPASASPSSTGGMWGNLVVMAPLLLMVLVLLFLSRADKKKRAQVESRLKKGDRVVTRSGLIGKIAELRERDARIEIAPGVTVTMLKTAIEGPEGGETIASGEKEPAQKDKEPKDKAVAKEPAWKKK